VFASKFSSTNEADKNNEADENNEYPGRCECRAMPILSNGDVGECHRNEPTSVVWLLGPDSAIFQVLTAGRCNSPGQIFVEAFSVRFFLGLSSLSTRRGFDVCSSDP
jgi:hypothetical protein